jgi:hypothetical protein
MEGKIITELIQKLPATEGHEHIRQNSLKTQHNKRQKTLPGCSPGKGQDMDWRENPKIFTEEAGTRWQFSPASQSPSKPDMDKVSFSKL